jgi:hypothetical protein
VPTHLQLDKALLDYNRLRKREAAQQGADSAASRRKSALPVRALQMPVGLMQLLI